MGLDSGPKTKPAPPDDGLSSVAAPKRCWKSNPRQYPFVQCRRVEDLRVKNHEPGISAALMVACASVRGSSQNNCHRSPERIAQFVDVSIGCTCLWCDITFHCGCRFRLAVIL
jgi:hypothetical protein